MLQRPLRHMRGEPRLFNLFTVVVSEPYTFEVQALSESLPPSQARALSGYLQSWSGPGARARADAPWHPGRRVGVTARVTFRSRRRSRFRSRSRFVTPSSWQRLPVESPPPPDAEQQRSGRLHNRRRALYYRGCKHPPTRSRGRMDCGCAKVHACCSRGNCSHHFSGTGERLAGCVCGGPNGKTYELDEEDVMGASDTGCV